MTIESFIFIFISPDYDESEEAYGPYPGSHLCLKFIVSVGKMIAGESLITADGLLHDEAQPTDTEYGPSATEVRKITFHINVIFFSEKKWIPHGNYRHEVYTFHRNFLNEKSINRILGRLTHL